MRKKINVINKCITNYIKCIHVNYKTLKPTIKYK